MGGEPSSVQGADAGAVDRDAGAPLSSTEATGALSTPANHGTSSDSTEPGTHAAARGDEADQRTTVQDHEWRNGQQIGRYQLERLIGRGACGEVWAARDPLLGRMVAIKLPRLSRLRDWPWLPHAIWAEARAAARISALSCCVPVFDFGWDASPTCYIVMQLMEASVADLIRTRQVSIREAARLVYRVSRRLHRAHLEGLVHCDLKPSNLLLDAHGEVYPTDFSTTLPRVVLVTESDLFVGTLPYMAPEQLEGRGFDYDCRTDCYALGVILYELLTGRRPFNGHSAAELVDAIRSGKFQPVSALVEHVPPELDELLRATLSYYRCRRPHDIRRFGSAVWRILRAV